MEKSTLFYAILLDKPTGDAFFFNSDTELFEKQSYDRYATIHEAMEMVSSFPELQKSGKIVSVLLTTEINFLPERAF